MPSPYTPPDVIVTQKRRTVTAANQLPQLALVVVGPARQIVRRGDAGPYTAGSAFSQTVPQLAPGATVDASTVQVLLDATSAAGKALGLFQLNVPNDAQVSGGVVAVNSDLALSYSLLSARNNNQPDSITDDDSGSGTPDGISFTDTAVDFLSKGASVGDTDVVISAPASMAGTYRIYALVGNGTKVNEVKVELLSDVPAGTKAMSKTFNITGGGYGNVNGTALINGTDTDASNSDVGLIPSGTIASIIAANYPALGGFSVPSPTSADQVVLVMPGGQPSNVTTAWNALVALSRVGDYLRIAGDATSNANGDFKIVALSTSAHSLTLIRIGQSGSGSTTSTGGGSATFKLLRVMKGKSDGTNAAGDYLTMVIGGVTTEFEIDFAEPKKVHLVDVVTGLTGATLVTARRGIPYRGALATYDIVKRLASGFTGEVLVTYEAARSDLSLNGLMNISSTKDIEDLIGVIHPNNPLALMCDMVTRSGLTDGNHSFWALATDDNTLASYEAAIITLETEDVYYIVPTTQEKAILSVLKAHVDAQSIPSNKHERCLVASTAIVTSEQIIPATGTTWPTDGLVNGGDTHIFASASIDWTLVSPGDMIKVLASSAPDAAIIEEHRISSVDVGSKRATCLDVFTSTPAVPVIFRIDSFPFTKEQQAEEWRDYAKSLADARVTIVRPDIVEITYTDKTGQTKRDVQIVVPSYYLAAAYAGVACSLPPQNPLTNVSLPGIDRVFHSNGYFTPDQLNTIAEGGNCIVIQDTKTSAPYSRHQLTTDMASIITREFSINKLVDFSAKYIRTGFRPFIGNKNITVEYLTNLRGIGEALLKGLVGADVLLKKGTSLDALFQDPLEPDATQVSISLGVPYPGNKVFVTLFI